ncbi:MAG: 3-dehydroquinate dehydratase [Bacteroidaceae bacterium]|nr:3-dehydroquinate dehydratase [Bacteroidaceae bacterium]
MKIHIVNGPNINLIGRREPGIYGSRDFDDYFLELQSRYPRIEMAAWQSNVEGEIISRIQEVGFDCDGIIINAGAYTHTSIGIQDAIRAVTAPVVEVHLSNVMQREDYRHVSMISPVCVGTVFGFGLDSYRLAVEALIERLG